MGPVEAEPPVFHGAGDFLFNASPGSPLWYCHEIYIKPFAE